MHELDLACRFADELLLLDGQEGRVDVGVPKDVLTPERVSEVFKVETQLVNGELRFFAPS